LSAHALHQQAQWKADAPGAEGGGEDLLPTPLAEEVGGGTRCELEALAASTHLHLRLREREVALRLAARAAHAEACQLELVSASMQRKSHLAHAQLADLLQEGGSGTRGAALHQHRDALARQLRRGQAELARVHGEYAAYQHAGPEFTALAREYATIGLQITSLRQDLASLRGKGGG
jgi:hypothetical protein